MDLTTENSTTLGANFTNTETDINESIVPAIAQFVFGLLGNITAMVFLIRSSKEHKWRPFYRLVAGLVISDMSAMALAYPFVISVYFSKFTFVFPTAICGFLSFTLTFFLLTSAFTVCAMSFDRFLAFIFPLIYRKLSKASRINLTLLGIWILTAIVCSLPLIGFGSFKSFYPGTWCFFDFTSDDAKNKAYTYIYTVIGLLIIAATTILNATVIFSVCWHFFKGERRSAKNKHRDLYIITYLVAVVILFVVCAAPLLIRMLMHVSMDDADNEKADLLTARLSVANAIIDPWIYLLFRRDTYTFIRRQARSLLRRFRMMRQVEGEGELNDVTSIQNFSERTEDGRHNV